MRCFVRKRDLVLLLLCATLTAHAQTFKTLTNFHGTDGAEPMFVSLVQGSDGNIYGTTSDGGADLDGGTVFRITLQGDLRNHSFNNEKDGGDPYAGLVLSADGNFYGTTTNGGNGFGTVFKITRNGLLTTLHTFCAQPPNCEDGGQPWAALIQGTDGKFYGTAVEYGVNHGGTVFKISKEGTLTALFSFCDQSNCTNGYAPWAGLVQAADGNFYGTTFRGGDDSCLPGYGCGTVFRISPTGILTTLHRFDDSDGRFPSAGLLEATDGNLYGTTTTDGVGCFPNTTCAGTIFKITPGGELTTLYVFCSQPNCTDGSGPYGALIQGADGKLYGTTSGGGAVGNGTVFSIALDGTLATLHDFDGTDGAQPEGGLLQATNGTFYGTTFGGGTRDLGTVFSLDMGLGPFVAFVRDSGKVGGTGGILGQGFTGTTSVLLNGTPANFIVVSDTFLRATVPNGATTGFVTVATPSGTLTSNKPFRVTPQLLSFNPPSGPAGTQVTITGVSLTQTQGVGFGDRVPAQFTVNSDTQVTAIVPAGAKTGKIGLKTKGGQAVSAGVFTVQ